MLFSGFNIQSMEKCFCCTGYFRISNAPDHSVIFIDRNPKHIATIYVICLYIQ